jgi:hypothetical protein
MARVQIKMDRDDKSLRVLVTLENKEAVLEHEEALNGLLTAFVEACDRINVDYSKFFDSYRDEVTMMNTQREELDH